MPDRVPTDPGEPRTAAARLRAVAGSAVGAPGEPSVEAAYAGPPSRALGRLAIGRRGVAALAVVALLAAVLAVVGYLRARPVAVPVPGVSLSGSARGGAPDAGAAAPSAQPTARLVVDVAGKVRHPGLVRLPVGARVADAVRAAGGPLPGTDLGLLNLAGRLVDGQQVVVGLPAAATGSGGAGAPPGEPVDLNTATAEQLDALPGVGPVLAQRIVDYRTAHGAFATVDDLEQVPGIGPSKLADLRDLVSV